MNSAGKHLLLLRLNHSKRVSWILGMRQPPPITYKKQQRLNEISQTRRKHRSAVLRYTDLKRFNIIGREIVCSKKL
jgi:hypothetical protein